jgi:hypothetical protein
MPAKPLSVGSKAQVFHGTALRTAGGLKKEDLMKTDKGRIVSKKQHASGLKAINRLRKAGFVAKKGEFKLFTKKSGSKKASPVASKRVTRSMSAAKTATRKAAAAKAAATRKAKKLAPIAEGGRRRANKNKSRRSFW